MMSLEMLGYYSERPKSQRYPPGLSLLYPNQGNFIGFVSNLSSRKQLRELKRAFTASSDFPCESLAAPEWTVPATRRTRSTSSDLLRSRRASWGRSSALLPPSHRDVRERAAWRTRLDWCRTNDYRVGALQKA